MDLVYKITDIVWVVVTAVASVIYIYERLKKKETKINL